MVKSVKCIGLGSVVIHHSIVGLLFSALSTADNLIESAFQDTVINNKKKITN